MFCNDDVRWCCYSGATCQRNGELRNCGIRGDVCCSLRYNHHRV